MSASFQGAVVTAGVWAEFQDKPSFFLTGGRQRFLALPFRLE